MLPKKYRILLLGISIAILAAIVWYANPALLVALLYTADLRLVLIAFIISSLSMCFRVLKWRILLKNVNFFELFPIQMLGITLSNFTPGKVGEPIKTVLLKMRKRIPVSESLPSIMWERIMDILILVIFALFAIQLIGFESKFYLISLVSIGIFAILVSILLVILYSKNIGIRIFAFLRKFPVLNKISKGFIETFYKSKIKKRRLLLCLFLTSIPWLLEGFVFYLAFLALGIQSNPIALACIVALSILIGIASFLPGGIGSAEAVMILLLGLTGIENTIAVAGVLLYRFLSLWYSIFIGGLSFVYLGRKIDIKNVFK